MVRLKSPFDALEARGKIDDLLIYGTRNGRCYARNYKKPKQVASNKQTSIRAAVRFLSQAWANLSDSDKATWQAPAKAVDLSPVSIFTATGVELVCRNSVPGSRWPVNPSGVYPTAPTVALVSGPRHVQLTITGGAILPNWAWVIYRRVGSSPLAAWPYYAAIIPYTGSPAVHIDCGLAPGTYYYQVRGLMLVGRSGNASVVQNATVT